MSEFDPFSLFPQQQRASLQEATGNLARSLPAEWTESFDAAWNGMLAFQNSDAYGMAQQQALAEHARGINAATGASLAPPLDSGLPGFDSGGGSFVGANTLDVYNAELDKLAERFPDLGIKPIDTDQLREMTLARMRQADAGLAQLAQREKTFGGSLGAFTGTLAGAGLDPVNLATLPFAGSGGIVRQALTFGALGLGTQAVNELVAAGDREAAVPGSNEQIAGNLLGAGLGGVLVGGAFGALGRAFDLLRRPSVAQGERDLLNVAASNAQTATAAIVPGPAAEMASRDALVQAATQLARGERITVAGIAPEVADGFLGRIAPALEARARLAEPGRLPPSIERLSEQQLAELRGAAIEAEGRHTSTAERLASAEEKLAADRAAFDRALPARQAEVDGQRKALQDLRDELAQREASVPPKRIDEATQGRLLAIEGDLAGPALTAERRTALQGERATIQETIAGRTAEQSSTDQEITGLRRAAKRQQDQLTRAEARLSAEQNRLQRRQDAARLQRSSLDERQANARAAGATELRKGVQRLAQEGYGLRLGQDDAAALAERIRSADDAALPGVLRGVTEELATRPRLPEAALPARRVDEAHWTGRLTEAVQDIARRAGALIAEDAARDLAAKLSRMSEGDAIHALAELTQRPLTIGERIDVGPVAAEALPSAPKGRVTGFGPLGPVIEGFEGRWNEALDYLRKVKTGDARGVLKHKEVGPIDVVWGEAPAAGREGYGLAKIVAKHPEVLGDLPERLAEMQVASRSANRIVLASERTRAVVRLDLDGEEKTWLLSAYEPDGRRGRGTTERPAGRQADTSSASPAAGNVARGGSPVEPGRAVASDAALAGEAARPITRAEIERLAADPQTEAAMLHDLDHIAESQPGAMVQFATRLPDGKWQIHERPLAEVLRELDGETAAAQDLQSCVVGAIGLGAKPGGTA